jgi:hypothetical protein
VSAILQTISIIAANLQDNRAVFRIFIALLMFSFDSTLYLGIIQLYTGHTQKNGAVSKVHKKFISHLTRAQREPSAAATF